MKLSVATKMVLHSKQLERADSILCELVEQPVAA